MQQEFSGFARDCRVWRGEVPGWASLAPVGVVDTYMRWGEPDAPPRQPANAAAWGMRVGHGGSGSYGLLGATFEPHEYGYLRAAVAVTLGEGEACPSPFEAATVGLPHEYVGGVLAGAMHAAALLGPGIARFEYAAVHPVDSSWEVFRILAIGVARLLALGDDEETPSNLLPFFGGAAPEPPSVHYASPWTVPWGSV